jgi:predicted enzyme related to lactoylglutathione lyase
MDKKISPKIVGTEFYFDDLEQAKRFYSGILGLPVEEELANHHTKLSSTNSFLCLEKKGVENYPSKDKAVVFLEVRDLKAYIKQIGAERIVKSQLTGKSRWVVVHDSEGYNVIILEAGA